MEIIGGTMRKIIYIILIISSFLCGKDWIQIKAGDQECNVSVLTSDNYQTLLEITIAGFYKSDTIISGQKYDNIEITGTGWRLTPGIPYCLQSTNS